MPEDLTLQVALPMRIAPDGQIATVPFGNPTEVAQRAICLCATRPGEVDGEPTFGLQDQAGRKGGANLALVDSTLKQWIPDIGVLIDTDLDLLNQALSYVGVRITT